MYPRQSPTTHTEQLGDEASVYDWSRAQVHALNPTAARVWRLCDGATSPDAIAAALRVETGVAEADAVVDLTLRQLARIHLLELPIELRGHRRAVTRRWLLGRGVAAAMLPAIASIVAPSPVEAQSGPGAPTLTGVAPNQGIQGTTVAVTLTGTNFVVGATTVTVGGSGVTVNSVVVGSGTSLTASFVLDPTAPTGARTVTVTTAGGTSGGQTFTINLPTPGAPTLTSVSPNQGLRGTTVAVTLTGTNFVVGATTVTVGGIGVTVANVAVSSSSSLTADFVLDLAAGAGPRTVTVTTAGGTSGPQTFTVTLPLPGSMTFNFTGSAQTFTVPAGVASITIQAAGAAGGGGFAMSGGAGALGGRTTATVSVTPGASLAVLVGGTAAGLFGNGGFNGGGSSTGVGGGGGGASSVRNGVTPLVIAGGGGGAGAEAGGGATIAGGNGGAGGGLTGSPGATPSSGGGGGGGGTQAAGGAGGVRGNLGGTDGTAGVADVGGIGGAYPPAVIGGGGGGGGYFGGGGGGGGNPGTAGGGGGGGGSSFAAPGATAVLHEQGVKAGAGFVTISW